MTKTAKSAKPAETEKPVENGTGPRRGRPNALTIDKAVGGRIRERRISMKMSQEELGKALHITFQQIQKYEKGSNAVPGTRVVAVCETLGFDPNYLFGWGGKAFPTDFTPTSYHTPVITAANYLNGFDPDLRRAICALISDIANRKPGA